MIKPEVLHKMVMSNAVIPIRFNQHRMLIDGRGVLYWPRHDMLVFSDLHFEKGSFLTQFAHPLPRFDTTDTIKRMANIIEEYEPKQLICLGDSFHDMNAGKRMQADDIGAINELVSGVDKWVWVLGNHDPEVPQALHGMRAPYFKLNNILFVHEPETLGVEKFTDCEAQVIGHFHPKSTHKLKERKVTGKSFLLGNNLMIMPAFGKYTGGLDSEHEAIQSLFDEQHAQAFLCYHMKVYMV